MRFELMSFLLTKEGPYHLATAAFRPLPDPVTGFSPPWRFRGVVRRGCRAPFPIPPRSQRGVAMERTRGLAPPTSRMAPWCSAFELRPHLLDTPSPVSEKTLFSCFPHSFGHHQPRLVGHRPAGVVAPDASREHVVFHVPFRVVDSIERHPEFHFPAVAATLAEEGFHPKNVKIVISESRSPIGVHSVFADEARGVGLPKTFQFGFSPRCASFDTETCTGHTPARPSGGRARGV